ncbi:hypothetical protein OHR68_03805 [Spirillospora sp. NBC_00431]
MTPSTAALTAQPADPPGTGDTPGSGFELLGVVLATAATIWLIRWALHTPRACRGCRGTGTGTAGSPKAAAADAAAPATPDHQPIGGRKAALGAQATKHAAEGLPPTDHEPSPGP